MAVVRLRASLREKVWGRRKLSPWFPDAAEPVGEAWFLADGEELPLLVKLLFTSDRLSVQVHPDDGEDGPRGKTEMWHILEAAPDATIALGFRERISRERLGEAVRTGEVEELLNWVPVRAGQTFFTPAHTVHAIGAGIVLCEIQQNSDVTYRLWDYGRPRELHVEQALRVSDLGVHGGAVTARETAPGVEELVRCRFFETDLMTLAAGESRPVEERTCHLWICLEGGGEVDGQECVAGEVWWIQGSGTLRSDVPSRFLRCFVPR